MKKFLSVLSFVLVLFCALTLASCNPTKSEESSRCKHKDTEKIVTIEGKSPTCQEIGLTDGSKCTECDTVIERQKPIDKIDCIESDWIIDYAPTQSDDGKKHTECTMCGKIMKEESIERSVLIDLTPAEFVTFANEYFSSQEESDTVRTVKALALIHKIRNGNYTADEMYNLVSTGVMEGTGLTSFQVDQMYGLYLWNRINGGDTTIVFETILDFMAIDIVNDEFGKTLIDMQTASDLRDLSDGLEEFKAQMDAYVTKEEFREFGKEKFGEDGWVQTACDMVFALASGGGKTAKVVEILRLVDSVSFLIPEEYQAYIKNYTYVYDAIKEECSYEEFLPVLQKVVLALSGEDRELNVNAYLIQQAYIMYFNSTGAVPDEKINGYEFINFVNVTIETNSAVSDNVSENSKIMLKDVILIADFLRDTSKYSYDEMYSLLTQLMKSLHCDVFMLNFTSNDVYGIFSIYASEH